MGAGDLRRSVADRASSYSRVVDEGKVIKSGAVSFGFFEVRHGCWTWHVLLQWGMVIMDIIAIVGHSLFVLNLSLDLFT